MFATETLPKGARILLEEPIITIPPSATRDDFEVMTSVTQQVGILTEEQRESFLSMRNKHPHATDGERYLGITLTISLPCKVKEEDMFGVFLDASRIRHSCDSNSWKNWNDKIKKHTVHALRDIQAGEEITVNFLGSNVVYGTRDVRQAEVKAKLGYDCDCRLCALPPEESQKSDEMIEEIIRLNMPLETGGVNAMISSPLHTLRCMDRLVQLLKEFSLDNPGLAQMYRDVGQICIANGDAARGRIFLFRACEVLQVCFGFDCKETMDNFKHGCEPTCNPIYALSDVWKTGVLDVVKALKPEEYQDWLWRRNDPIPEPVVGMFRSRTFFPGVGELPEDSHGETVHQTDMEKEEANAPRRHWCFLGEITEHTTMRRLQLKLNDIDGKTANLYCCTPGLGREFDQALVQPGHTVAVLYAERAKLLSIGETPGIRVDDPGCIKVCTFSIVPMGSVDYLLLITLSITQIIPVGLNALLSLSDQYKQFATMTDGARICHVCLKKTILRCAKCSSAWYCSKVSLVAKAGYLKRGLTCSSVARKWDGRSKDTRPLANSSRTSISEGCSSSIGTNSMVALALLRMVRAVASSLGVVEARGRQTAERGRTTSGTSYSPVV
jgi:hypothetical protein